MVNELPVNQDEQLENMQLSSERVTTVASPTEDDNRSTSSATIETNVTSGTKRSDDASEINHILENIFNDQRVDAAISDGESSTESNGEELTSMSSILLSDVASHLHDTPMEIIPEIPLGKDTGISMGGRKRNGMVHKRSSQISLLDEEYRSSNGGDTTLFPRDCEDRPHEVFIKTYSNQSVGSSSDDSGSKSRRYRPSRSFTRIPESSNDLSITGNSVATNGLSSLLQTIGITTQDEYKNQIPSLINPKKSRRERLNRMLHLRAGMLMIFLISLTFFLVQLSAVAQHDVYLQQDIRSHQDAYVLRSNYQNGKQTSLRGSSMNGNKIPSTLHAFDNPVRVTDGAKMATQSKSNEWDESDTQRKVSAMTNNNELKTVAKQKISKTDLHGPVDSILDRGNTIQTPHLELNGALEIDSKRVLSSAYDNMSYTETPVIGSSDVPFFWSIPQSGAEVIKEVLKLCMSTVIASEAGGNVNESDTDLRTVTIFGRRFINVDVSSTEGIQRARQLNLASSGLPDVIISPLFHDALELFDSNHHGRAFTLIRHPLERAASTYYNLKRAKHSSIGEMTIMEYARSPYIENNWMVRYLSGKVQGDLNKEHLMVAKEVLRTRFIIGLADKKEESMKRFENYFNFKSDPSSPERCAENIILNLSDNTNVREGTEEWALLEWQNKFDMDLYQYSQELFQTQGVHFFKDKYAI